VTGVCTATALASYDLSQWQNAVADPNTLPQSSWSVVSVVTGNQTVYTITIGWVDRRAEANNATGTTGITYDATSPAAVVSGGVVVGERFSYTAIRTIFN
jgi:hypothetical protein